MQSNTESIGHAPTARSLRVLVIDHHDSYTFNLVQLIATVCGGITPTVVEQSEIAPDDPDDPVLAGLRRGEFTHLVLSPGPGNPDTPADFAGTRAAIDAADPQLPLLGVCLGHQGLALLAGATISRLPRPHHGHVDQISHTGQGIFAGIPSPAQAVRYHSLHVTDLPEDTPIQVHAHSDDGTLMGFTLLDEAGNPTNRWGVQYHPESILTDHGDQLIRNFLALGPEQSSPDPIPVFTETLTGTDAAAIDLEATFEALQSAAEDAAIWLDTSSSPGFSIMAVHDPTAPLSQLIRWDALAKTLHIASGDTTTTVECANVLDYLRAHHLTLDQSDTLAQLSAMNPGPESPVAPVFTGGWLGYLSYEARLAILPESRPTDHDPALPSDRAPEAYWLRPQSYVLIDHADTEAVTIHLVAYHSPELLDRLRAALRTTADAGTSTNPEPTVVTGESDGAWNLSDADYRDAIASIKEELAAGESYELCLTDTWHAQVPDLAAVTSNNFQLYRRLRRSNPAPYSAYLRFTAFGDDLEVLCTSPERFLSIDTARRIETKPIKGTVARDHTDPEVDQHRAAQMAADPKTRAENLMIVDLLRNDLGRVAEIGSVTVPVLMGVESYATVHQLVSTVRATLAADRDVADALTATFPGGSMIGAPKIRTLHIIDSLEPEPRGIYSGTIGWWGFDGAADLNIVIRTIVRNRSDFSVGAGGAIIYDSDPDAELAERNLKARILREQLTTYLNSTP